MISHNGILDLMYLYSQFERPLPASLTEFKSEITRLLPHIYDNKHMINTRLELQSLFPSTSLSDTYLRVMNDVNHTFKVDKDQKVKINEWFSDYALDGKVYHEAGFDALMTGIVWF